MIIIVSSDMCPYCQMAKQLISDLGFEYIENKVQMGSPGLMEIVNITGMMTVPQIFVGEISKENLLGGYSEIAKLHEDGELTKIFNKNT